MLPALDWLATARACFADECGGFQRGLLTSVFALVVGLERIFHLDEMNDVGFALLSGGRHCPTRQFIGGWRRHLCWYEVDAFCRRTCSWHLPRGEDVMASFDEHTIPRWTRKFRIGKGYVTTRNNYMRCEKLFYGFGLNCGRYLSVRGAPGDTGLADLAVPLVRKRPVSGRLASSGTMAVFFATKAPRKPQPCFAALAATSSRGRSGVT
jgi:hypothetical protein